MKSADYSDGRNFAYVYDANGNTLEASDQSETTTYTYDAANQLVTAQKDLTTWNYVYDANGSLTEVLPGGNEVNSAKRYTYNAAGYLTKVESHDGSSWSTQSEMAYNGLGVRLTSSALGVTTYYASDGQMPLTITSINKATTILYGLGPVAEKMEEWNYVLTDGVGVPRQLTDSLGMVTLSVRYSPWGKPMEISGTGNFDASFIGTLIDASTGLIYVGNGQYYDPETGRFLTRGANPNSPNPYVPWNPINMILGPLGMVSSHYIRKQAKKIRRNPGLIAAFSSVFLLACSALALFVVIGGILLIACTASSSTPPVTPPGTVTPPITSTLPPTVAPIPPTGTPEPILHCELIGEFYMSAYYIPLESEYTDVDTDSVAISATPQAKINSGHFADQQNVYLSSTGPHYYNDDGEAFWQHANWRFLNDDDGVCMQGSGKLENGWYISCTTPQGSPKEFEWQLDEKVNRLKNSVVDLETVAVCGYLAKVGGPLTFGTEISIPAAAGFMQDYRKDTTFTVRDTGEKLCPEVSGRSHQTIDLFVGEGRNAYKIYDLLRVTFPAPVKVYK